MPPRHAVRAGLVAVVLAAGIGSVWGAPTPAAAETSTFDLSLAGLPLGTVTMGSARSGDAYEAISRITPNGFVAAMTSYSFDGRATGRIVGEGRVQPETFTAESSSPRADRRTEIEWRDGAPVRVSVVPPRKHQPDPSHVVGAIDPVSAGFALLRDAPPEAICDVTVEVFDGSRRSRLSLGAPQARGEAFVCAGMYARIEGEAHSLSSQTEYPFTLTFAPKGDGTVRLERIETETRFGAAVVSRRS